MTESSNGSAAIRSGLNAPSAVRRLLILGYYDGATDGVIEFGPGPEVFEFRQTSEVHNPDAADRRTFQLRPLPPDAIDQLVRILSPHLEPAWPVWAPVWRFPDERTRLDVEAAVNAVLSAAGPIDWEIETDDLVTFSHFHAKPLRSEPVIHG
jgi:hypothetical protein